MSTSFEVYPCSEMPLTFGEVLSDATRHINRFLAEHQIDERIALQPVLDFRKPTETIPLDQSLWELGETGCWVGAASRDGWFEVSCDDVADPDFAEDAWWVLDEIRSSRAFNISHEEHLSRIRGINRQWVLTRWAGLPAVLCLGYGYMSATLAEMTTGLVYSATGAWDHDSLPMNGPEFREIFFRPDLAATETDASNSRRCIQLLRDASS